MVARAAPAPARAPLARARQLLADEGERDHARGVHLVHEAAQCESRSPRVCALGEQRLELVLAHEIAGAVARLRQVELLLEPHEVAVDAHPAARRALAGGPGRLLERPLVR